MALQALYPWHYIREIKFFGKALPKAVAENCVDATISGSMDSVTELTLSFVDPYFKMLSQKYFELKVAVDYKDYKLSVVSKETAMFDGVEGVVIRCRPMLVQKLKDRQGAYVMKNASPADFIRAETKAAGGVAVVQPLAKRAQVSRDVPAAGESYDNPDDKPSSWTTFRRLADENGYLLFEHSNVIYFGKPSWLLKTLPMGKFEVWYMNREKANTLTMPICTRSLDSSDETVTVSIDPRIAIQARVGRTLSVKDMPTFSKDYLINSVSYSLLNMSGAVQIQATTMKDKKPTGVTDAQLNQWAGGGLGGGEITGPGLDGGSTGVPWLDAMMKQVSSTNSSINWDQYLIADNLRPASAPMGNVQYGQSLNLSKIQLATAATIIETTYNLGFPRRAAIIAVATAKQESDLGADKTCYKPNGDYDAGVFQQRVLKGWYGTLAQVNNVVYGTTVFLKGKKLTAADVAGARNPAGPIGYTIPGLAQIKNWQSMSLTRAAQAVQRSAYPNAYAKWEGLATKLVDQYVRAAQEVSAAQQSLSNVFGGGSGKKHPFVKNQSVTCEYGRRGSAWSLGWHTGTDYAASNGTPCYAVADGTIVNANWGSSFGTHVILEIAGGKRFAYCHLQRKLVSPGQKVRAGAILGYCDSTGNVRGAHLHVEARNSPYRWPNDNFNPDSWYRSYNPTPVKYGGSLSGGGGLLGVNSKSNSKSVLDFVRLCKAQAGDRYVYGAEASPNNANPSAWDCSELIEWACARVGVYFPDGTSGQYAYCREKKTLISVEAAMKTYGAILFRQTFLSPHVAVSLRNGRTIEAVNTQYGVREMKVAGRIWTHGAKIPGMSGYGYGDSLRSGSPTYSDSVRF